MWLLDQWAERHILDAQSKGEFDNLTAAANRWRWMMIHMCRRNCAPVTAY